MTEQWNLSIRQFIYQNISAKYSPADINLELITKFSINKSFEEASCDSEEIFIDNNDPFFRWRVLSLDDLLIRKIKAGRTKDLLDIQELKKIHNS